ncbi:hypothetical protein D5086_008217 [Populus alba]|uniref:Uncharacterized protein n=2 Tax=Populus TaxID=3689 RepID=A0ACC4CGD3_POPAL|nr:hypothetical protein NC653_010725 [Populus alba x Populus x berolinensis]
MGWIKTDEPKAMTEGLSELDSSNGAEGIENESVKSKLWTRGGPLLPLGSSSLNSLLSLCCRKRRPFHGSCAHVNPDSTNEKIRREELEQVADKNLILYIASILKWTGRCQAEMDKTALKYQKIKVAVAYISDKTS